MSALMTALCSPHLLVRMQARRIKSERSLYCVTHAGSAHQPGAILHSTPIPASQVNPQLSAEVETLINKALEKNLSLRYQHAADITADLRRVQRDFDTGNGPRTSPKFLPRNRSVWLALPLAVLLLILALFAANVGGWRLSC